MSEYARILKVEKGLDRIWRYCCEKRYTIIKNLAKEKQRDYEYAKNIAFEDTCDMIVQLMDLHIVIKRG